MSCCDETNNEETIYICSKHQTKMCAACARCQDPELYCKFRPSCMIHFMDKERRRAAKRRAS